MLEPYTDTAVPRSDRLVTRTGHLTADPPDRVGYCAVTGEAVAALRAASSAAWAGVSAACWGLSAASWAGSVFGVAAATEAADAVVCDRRGRRLGD